MTDMQQLDNGAQWQASSAAMLIAQASAMSAVNEQLKNLVEGSQRTERTLGKLDDINRMVVELKVIAENNKSTFARLFDRLEKVEASIDREDMKDAAMQTAVALKADTQALNMVESKITNWIGHFRGALTMATLCMGIVQAALIGGGAYIITHLQQNETGVAVMAQRLDGIERTVRETQQTVTKESRP